MDRVLRATWKEIGSAHARFANFEQARTLYGIADATQQI
jgi:cytochrome b